MCDERLGQNAVWPLSIIRWQHLVALLLQRTNQYAETVDYWRRYLASDCQSEWAARARRSLKFCEMQINLIASA